MTSIIPFAIIAAGAVLYFLPFVVAFTRRRPGWAGLLVLNILIGWTLIGWVAVLVWAVSNPPAPKVRERRRRRAIATYLRDFGRAKVENVVFATPPTSPGVLPPAIETAADATWQDEGRERFDPYADWLSTKRPS